MNTLIAENPFSRIADPVRRAEVREMRDALTEDSAIRSAIIALANDTTGEGE